MGELDEVGRLRSYVADLQSSLNAHLAGLGSHERLEVDGEWGERTALAFRRVCRVLGLEPVRHVRTFRLVVGATQRRTPEELARAQAEGAAYAQRLRHHFGHEATSNGGGGGGRPGAGGLEFLAGNIRRTGLRPGVVAYNGSGPAAQRYADDVLARARVWDKRLRAARRPRPGRDHERDPVPVPTPPVGKPRTFRLESPLMRGRDIAAFQRLLNERFAAWNVDKRIDVDGEYGPMTRRAARQAVYALGISGTELAHGVTPELRTKLRRPSGRSPDEVAHASRRRGWLGRLRRQHEGRGAQAVLAYARKHLGVVESPPSTNRGPLIDRWNRATGTAVGSPWCGNFANACLMAAGFPAEPWLKLCSAIEGNAKAAKGGWQWTTAPRPGDLVLFTVGGAANHVGVVEAVGRAGVVTIEGNTHKDYDPGRFWEGYGVFRRHHRAGQSAIRGYARPPYGR
jgi:hypothetical protein